MLCELVVTPVVSTALTCLLLTINEDSTGSKKVTIVNNADKKELTIQLYC